MGKLIQKSIEGVPGYAIFFDNIRVDKYVKNFSTNIAIDGSIGSASLEMLYIPDFYRMEGESSATSDTTIVDTEDGIEDMTNVKIFIKNMFSDKYIMVFDGNIRSCSLTRNANGYGLSFMAQDYMTWLNRTIVPLAVPMADQMSDGDRLKWKTYGIDVSLIPALTQNKDIAFKGKTITEYIENIKNKTLDINKIYSNSDTVSYWDHVTSRLAIMGDIEEQLVKSNIVDFVVTSGATSVNSMYIAINDIAKNLMFEFFQDRDGVIRVKPPFWNETVLYDHIIEPLTILNYTENKNWAQRYTRVVTTGALEDYLENIDTISDLTTKQLFTPVASYNGESFSDYTSGEVVRTQKANKNGLYGFPFLPADKIPLPGEWGGFGNARKASTLNGVYAPAHKHAGIDIPPFTSETPEGYVYHIGFPGTVSFHDDSKTGTKIATVVVSEGPYKGYLVRYLHLSAYNYEVEGQTIAHGAIVGIAGKTGHTEVVHLHFEVLSPDRVPTDPVAYIKVVQGVATFAQVNNEANVSVGSDNLLLPTKQEKKYGISVYDVTQPLIKVSTAAAMDSPDVVSALKKYSIFMHNLLNSAVEVANIQTIAMPWIRPGFNVWVDPVYLDKIFYVNAISHVGSPEGGVFTTLSLGLGRSRAKCVGAKGAFGRVLASAGHTTDNVFINQIKEFPEDFGKALKTPAEYTKIQKKCTDFYKSNDDSIIKANNNPYFKSFYGTANYDSKISSKVIKPVKKTLKYRYSAWPALKEGSRGVYVTELQKALADAGFYKETYFDTIFGKITKAALIAFQSYYKLSQSGVLDTATKNKIQSVVEASASTTVASSSSGGKLTDNFFAREYTIDEIQMQLNTLYAAAPKPIKDRVTKLKKIMTKAQQYVDRHYITDAR